jgi:hypothetical protein
MVETAAPNLTRADVVTYISALKTADCGNCPALGTPRQGLSCRKCPDPGSGEDMQCRVMRDAGLVLFVVLAMMRAGSLCAAEDPQLAEIVKALQSEAAGSKCPTAAIRRAGGSKDSPGAATLIHAGLFLLRSGLIQKAKACILQAQQKTPRSPWVWAAVAEALRAPGGSANATELAEAALSQGLLLGGGISTGTPQLGLPMHWDVLGPFPIGKAEVDGDPLESPAIGGVARARTSARGERRQFPSEYAEGGFVQWRVLPAATPVVQIEFPDIEAPPVPPPTPHALPRAAGRAG